LVVWRRRDMLSIPCQVGKEVGEEEGIHTPMPARSKPVTESCKPAQPLANIVRVNAITEVAYLVSNHRQELPVAEVCLRRHVGGGSSRGRDLRSGKKNCRQSSAST
jgi:hypothetical protein